ncbi:class I SAM-dependent methyltransferase [Sutcliffiella horikoshii]|uniref:Class I SAM-dependent methyltransferase n=1 Tax=Sutcliffiella horikoshii TaxID=79883 RepID=A0AA95B5D9_9BACI|nr:class I SAM-dependent methyltransferase [Sutcliffiella horikoshii]TYS55888.1 class I SAM-dependent methyltransferase [Sutcliffiella horikoshii]
MNNIFSNNLEKYEDANEYDRKHENFLVDLPLILEWAPKDSPIIELACGTGRLTIPLAEQGHEMIGVDIHAGMLERAKAKAIDKNLPIQWYLQDCTQLSLTKSTKLMFMSGNSFQHFLTNEVQDALFQSVHRHLEAGGIFIFDTRNPIMEDLSKVDEYEEHFTHSSGILVAEYHKETYQPMTQILHCETERRFFNGTLIESIEKDRILLRYVFPLEMRRLLNEHGFKVLHEYGDWNKSLLTANSPQMVYVCQKKGSS